MFEIVRVEREPENFGNRIGRRSIGWVLTLIGVGVLVLFLRSLVEEVMTGTFYGAFICILALVFGALLTRDGIALAIDRRIRLRPVQD